MRLAYHFYTTLFLALSIAFFSACRKPAITSENGIVSYPKTTETAIPEWLQKQITAFRNAKPANPPIKISRYNYQGKTVYYITGRCCDIPSQVYSVEGQKLCEPEGGFTGRGDGKCTDFFETRTDEKLIWEDLRK